jgi:hypothetical protein
MKEVIVGVLAVIGSLVGYLLIHRLVRAVRNSRYRKALREFKATGLEVVGDRDKFLKWLTTPHPWLDNELPVDVLKTPAGIRKVTEILQQMHDLEEIHS